MPEEGHRDLRARAGRQSHRPIDHQPSLARARGARDARGARGEGEPRGGADGGEGVEGFGAHSGEATRENAGRLPGTAGKEGQGRVGARSGGEAQRSGAERGAVGSGQRAAVDAVLREHRALHGDSAAAADSAVRRGARSLRGE